MKHRILILYKRSLFQLYFQGGRQVKGAVSPERLKVLQFTHHGHYQCLDEIKSVIKNLNLKYSCRCRGSRIDYSQYDLIITVGGDGTFLEAARNITDQLIFGVNSNPEFSYGKLCTVPADKILTVLNDFLAQKISILKINRLRLEGPGIKHPVDFTNDILIAHSNPASMSRYMISIGNTNEEHRNSGLWIATAAGSSGAIHSAGAKHLPINSQKFLYQPRELFTGLNKKYRLTGGTIAPKQKIEISSSIRNGMIFVDGAHQKIEFPIGHSICISRSPYPLNVVIINGVRSRP
ncbi:MAG: NAD(+)/NADH kinase [Candidatus Omnitrophica bacterium]|nr:NAD(+)/NADH kinase [Candidatus Omnitrophota bacterium]